MPESLLQLADQQPPLFSDLAEEERVFKESEERGEFTAERLFKRRRDIYEATVKLLARGLGQIFIGDLLKVSPSTVRAVAKREGIAIGIEKKELAEVAFANARLAAEVVAMVLSDPKKRAELGALDAAKIMSLMTDRGLVLAGEANVIVESKAPAKPQHEDFVAYLDGLKQANAPGMGLGGEKNGAQGDGAERADLAGERRIVDVPGEVAVMPVADAESEVSEQKPKETHG